MAFAFPHPTHLPCPDCGESVANGERETHQCDEDRKFWYEHQDEVDDFFFQLAQWLRTPQGRFEQWLAVHRR
jgi:hypothetical protein